MTEDLSEFDEEQLILCRTILVSLLKDKDFQDLHREVQVDLDSVDVELLSRGVFG
jgi:hypothetical protein